MENSNTNTKTHTITNRKVLFWVGIILAMLLLLKSFLAGGVFGILLILIIWAITLFILKQFSFNGKYTWWLAIVVFVLAIIFSFMVIPSKTHSPSSNDNKAVSKNVQKYDGKSYKITSENGDVFGSVEIKISKSSSPVTAYYNINIKNALPPNKVCFVNTDNGKENCRWVDYYNYAGGILTNNGKAMAIGQIQPVFCDTFMNVTDASKGLIGEYMDCWYGKTDGKQKNTDKFYWWSTMTYKSIDDFLAGNIFSIHDAQPYTKRERVTVGNSLTSTDSMDIEKALEQGKKMNSYKLNFEDK